MLTLIQRRRPLRFAAIAGLTLGALFLAAYSPADAQIYRVYYPPVAVPAPGVTYTYYPPAPTVSYVYYPPPVTRVYYSAPPNVSCSQEPSTACSPQVVYSAPVVPQTVYAAPAPSVVTTRTFVGLGIFRPRGVHTVTYYNPVVVVP